MAIKENGSAALVSFTYDDLGRRKKKLYFNGQSTVYSYDNASRLTQLNMPGVSQSISLTYDDANRIKSRTSHTGFTWLNHYGVDRSYTVDRLNRLKTSTPVGGSTSTYTHDQRGNIQADGSGVVSYYDSLNRWGFNNADISMQYDGLHRMHRVYNHGNQTGQDFGYDGSDLITEYKAGASTVLRRYVHGPGTDEPLIWYEGSGTSDKRSLIADERGSIVLIRNSTGAHVKSIGYDEYGNATTLVGRFGYTGQAWIPEIGQYYYKARLYAPTLGRFMQTDPIRLGDGMNMYAYVKGDPINHTDPTGLNTPIGGLTIIGSSSGGGSGGFAGISFGGRNPFTEFEDYSDPEHLALVAQQECVAAGGQFDVINVVCKGGTPRKDPIQVAEVNFCPVIVLGLEAGAALRASVSGTVGSLPASAAAGGSLGSARVEFGLGAEPPKFGQDLQFSAEYASVNGGGKLTREVNLPATQGLGTTSWKYENESFVGWSAGGTALLGAEVKIGYKIVNGDCPKL